LYPLLLQYLGQPRIGKVRDTYDIPGHPKLLLVAASDRMSIYDFVLGTLIPDKGYVLTAATVFWFTGPLKHIKNHLVAAGVGIDQYLPEALRGNRDLQRRAIVVRRHKMLPVECIVRGCLTGSGWRDYEKGNPVSGHMLRKGYHDRSASD
jgi:phosphoribosylaminoimidazole-succinocarboxamide synthase